jgi:hypothetical protein
MKVRRELALDFALPASNFDFDTCSSQALDPLTRHLRIGIGHTNDNSGNTSLDHRISTWGRATMMRAWFEGDIHRRTSRCSACFCQRNDFCMRAGSTVGCSDETRMIRLPLRNDNCSDPRSGRDATPNRRSGSHCLTHAGLVRRKRGDGRRW